MIKLSAATRKMTTGIAGIMVMGWALVMSAYSIYFVTRHLGVPHFFAAGGSIAYDGGAIFSAAKSLQDAQDGRSGLNARICMAACVALSAFCNAMHPILGRESLLSIPYWAGLPIAAAWMFEIHTSQARFKAQARMGKRYPAPTPAFGVKRWLLFPLDTLNSLMDYVFSQGAALMGSQGITPRKILRARRRAEYASLERNPVTTAYPSVTEFVTDGVTEPVTAGVTEPVTDSVTGDSVTSSRRESVTGPEPGREASPVAARTAFPGPRVSGPDSPVAGRVSGPSGGSVTGQRNGLGLARNCEQCGRPFVSKTPHGRFCGANCRVAWNRAKAKNEEAS